MTQLANLVHVTRRGVRAVNLEHDAGDASALHDYTLGPHIIELLRRLLSGLQPGARDRAWSVTGPFGVGKSSFANFAAALLGPADAPAYAAARELLDPLDPQLAATLDHVRAATTSGDRGLLPALVVAGREPIGTALSRALTRAASTLDHAASRSVAKPIRALSEGPVGRTELLSAFDALTRIQPVLLVVDELGKALEHAAARPDDSDLTLLQDLAERCSNSNRADGAILTIQHLAFDDYAHGVPEARRREWRKIQGRFHDVAFVSGSEHSRRLMTSSLRPSELPVPLKAAAAAAATALSQAAPASDDASITPEFAGSVYPLHPLTAAILPDLTARFGQHERSLLGFLTSDAPDALPRFLTDHDSDETPPPFVRPHQLYAHFVRSGSFDTAGPQGALLREVRNRVEQTHGLSALERRVAETVGLLNLVSPRLGLPASPAVVEALFADVQEDDSAAVRGTLRRLEERQVLTYRGFADEYRVWSGSDFDIEGRLAAGRAGLSMASSGGALISEIERIRPPRPIVAARHSLTRHVLRYFESAYAHETVPDAPLASRPDADGLVLWVISTKRPPRDVPTSTKDGRPVVVVWGTDAAGVLDAAVEITAVESVLQQSPELDDDPVARRELRHRSTAAHAALAERIAHAFGARAHVFSGGQRYSHTGGRQLSRLVSELCEERYPKTPVIPNEMVNRRDLTSQGAKARRELLVRMFDNEEQPLLGIEGSGPERAMYDAMLASTGVHRQHDGEQWSFGPPRRSSSLTPAWREVERFLDGQSDRAGEVAELYERLAAPPFGMKTGPIPVLLAAALLSRPDDVFLYESGSFVPIVTAANLERLLKDPRRFAVKRAGGLELRQELFEELERVLANEDWQPTRGTRNRTTLAIVRPLLAMVREWPQYTRRTDRVSDRAMAVRSALLEAKDPDRLLLHELPVACGLASFLVKGDAPAPKARTFSRRLFDALVELTATYPRLREEVEGLVGTAFETPADSRLRDDLRARSAHLKSRVVEPRIRAFLELAGDASPSDDEWLEALVMNLMAKPLSSWGDTDRIVFDSALAERAHWFRRLEALRYDINRSSEAPGDVIVRRVAVTSPSGHDQESVVRYSRTAAAALESVADEALDRAVRALGPSGDRALLALLAERVLADESDTTTSVDARSV